MSHEVSAFVEALDPEPARCVRRVLNIADEAVDGLQVSFAPGWGTLNLAAPKFFGAIGTTKVGIRLYLEWGTLLDDPAGYIDRFGKRSAQKDIRSECDIDSVLLAALIAQAAAIAAEG